jgi:hypothetical protein
LHKAPHVAVETLTQFPWVAGSSPAMTARY